MKTATIEFVKLDSDNYSVTDDGQPIGTLERTPGKRWRVLNKDGVAVSKAYKALSEAQGEAATLLLGDSPISGQEGKDPKAAAPPPPINQIIWIKDEVPQTAAVSSVTYFNTACGRYRACRIDSGGEVRFGVEKRVESRWDSVEKDAKLGPGYPRYYSTLRGAMEAAQANLAQMLNMSIIGNMEDVLTAEGPVAPPVLPKQPKHKTTKQSGGTTKSGPIWGFSECAVIRQLGLLQWPLEQVKKVVEVCKMGITPSSVTTSYSDGKTGKGSRPASLTEAQLEAIREGVVA